MINEAREFRTVAVIGAGGRVGRLVTNSLSKAGFCTEAVIKEPHADSYPDIKPPRSVTVSTDLAETLNRMPDVVVLATPNPTEGVLKSIALSAARSLTLVLPQNGVDVVPKAIEALKVSKYPIKLVRASLLTTVATDEAGDLVYDPTKKRIALSPVSEADKGSVDKTRELFEKSGFKVKLVANYQSMEWTKLLANRLGSTSAVTGLSPIDTFRDRALFKFEHKALKDGFKILKAAGIPVANISWVNKLRLLAAIPTPIATLIRGPIAKQIAKERNNQPPAALNQVKKDQPIEAIRYYHKPVVQLAETHGLSSPVDSALLEILTRQSRIKFNSKDDFDLNKMSAEAKIGLLSEIVDLESREVYIPSKAWMTKAFGIFHNQFELALDVKGRENLEKVMESLGRGRSAVFCPKHLSHADHFTFLKALKKIMRENLGGHDLAIVANMVFDKELITKLFQHALNRILVWTLKPGASEEEKWRAQIINRKSMKFTSKFLDKASILGVYPEGSRIPDGIGEAVPGASGYLQHNNTEYAIPTAIYGTQIMLPARNEEDKVGNRWPRLGWIFSKLGLGSINRFQFPNEAVLSVEFGEPIDLVELRRLASHLPRNERDAYMSGVVMAAVRGLYNKNGQFLEKENE